MYSLHTPFEGLRGGRDSVSLPHSSVKPVFEVSDAPVLLAQTDR